MDLREAVAKIEEYLEKSYETKSADYSDGLAWALQNLRSVEGAWVDVSPEYDMKAEYCTVKSEYQTCCNAKNGPQACRCKTIADDPRCPAVILKEG